MQWMKVAAGVLVLVLHGTPAFAQVMRGTFGVGVGVSTVRPVVPESPSFVISAEAGEHPFLITAPALHLTSRHVEAGGVPGS